MSFVGTFIIRPTLVMAGDTPVANSFVTVAPYKGWVVDNYPVNSILTSIKSETNQFNLGFAVLTDAFSTDSLIRELRLAFTGLSIYLDGSLVPIAFATLPAGFTPLSASVKINISAFAQPAVGHAHYHLQHEGGINGIVDTDNFPYDFTIPPSMLDIYSNGCGLKCDISVGDVLDVAEIAPIWDIRVEGTYTSESVSWFIPYETRIVNGRPFRVPTSAAVVLPTDSNPDPSLYYNAGLVSDNPTGLTLYYWFSPDWWFFFPLSILIPDDISDWTPTLVAPTCTSCLTLTLGAITILVADASGAYTLQSGKTNDTMYVRAVPAAVTTDDAPIPSPNAKIGFVP